MDQRHGVLASLDGFLHQQDFGVIFAQIKIRCCDLRNQNLHHGLLVFLCAQKICTRRLGGAAQLTETVDSPRSVSKDSSSRRNREVGAGTGGGSLTVQLRKQSGARRGKLAFRLNHSLRGDVDVVICFQRLRNEGAKRVVLEKVKPLYVAQRSRAWLRFAGAKLRWCRHVGSLVVGSYSASGQGGGDTYGKRGSSHLGMSLLHCGSRYNFSLDRLSVTGNKVGRALNNHIEHRNKEQAHG